MKVLTPAFPPSLAHSLGAVLCINSMHLIHPSLLSAGRLFILSAVLAIINFSIFGLLTANCFSCSCSCCCSCCQATLTTKCLTCIDSEWCCHLSCARDNNTVVTLCAYSDSSIAATSCLGLNVIYKLVDFK